MRRRLEHAYRTKYYGISTPDLTHIIIKLFLEYLDMQTLTREFLWEGKWFSPGECAVRSAINCAPSRGGLAIGIGAMENMVEVGRVGHRAWRRVLVVILGIRHVRWYRGGVCNGNEYEAWMLG
eukprot:Gb_29208 [translate_table: standard]